MTALSAKLPQDLEAERSVLGACLFDPDAVDRAADLLRPADFFLARHALIFTAILELAEKFIQVREDTEGNLMPIVVGRDGQPRLTKKVGSADPMGFDELIDEMRESQSTKGLFDTQASGGSGASSQSGGSGGQQNQGQRDLSARELLARAHAKQAG